jgi:hypothetical protein
LKLKPITKNGRVVPHIQFTALRFKKSTISDGHYELNIRANEVGEGVITRRLIPHKTEFRIDPTLLVGRNQNPGSGKGKV